ncbi:MAG: hypothetical protein QXE66_06950 [Desulfurococcaceae archaeon]
MGRVVKCPFCGFEAGVDSFKQLREPWRFRFYEVKMFERLKVQNVFNYYEGTSPRSKHSLFIIFTIRVKPRTRKTVKAEGKPMEHLSSMRLGGGCETVA